MLTASSASAGSILSSTRFCSSYSVPPPPLPPSGIGNVPPDELPPTVGAPDDPPSEAPPLPAPPSPASPPLPATRLSSSVLPLQPRRTANNQATLTRERTIPQHVTQSVNAQSFQFHPWRPHRLQHRSETLESSPEAPFQNKRMGSSALLSLLAREIP